MHIYIILGSNQDNAENLDKNKESFVKKPTFILNGIYTNFISNCMLKINIFSLPFPSDFAFYLNYNI